MPPGILTKASHMLGPRSSLSAMPSTWYADAAVPNTNPFGKLRRLSPPVHPAASSPASTPPPLPLSPEAPAAYGKQKQQREYATLHAAATMASWTRTTAIVSHGSASAASAVALAEDKKSGRGRVCGVRHSGIRELNRIRHFGGMSRKEKLAGNRRNG